VRISLLTPTNAGTRPLLGLRIPEVEEDIDISIDDKDLRIDTYVHPAQADSM